MSPMFRTLTFALVLSVSLCRAAEEKPATKPGGKAVYTFDGIKRITENVKALDENIKDLQANLSNIDKNIQTVASELAELKTLLDDYTALRAKFAAKVSSSKEEMVKNNEALQKLQKYSRALDSARQKQVNAQTVKIQQESATREIAERERWNLDATHKLKRLQDLLAELETSSKNIRAKQPNLEREMAFWRKQTVDYQSALDTYQKQRNELNDLLSARSVATPQKGQ